jgi:muramoyltetrapeptide carboxypeptidase
MADSILYPPRLNLGDRVAVVATAGPVDSELLNAGESTLKSFGFDPVRGRHLLNRDRYFSGSDQERAEDLNWALAEPTIRAVFCARGGSGTQRILSVLDLQAVVSDPKPIIGFSDVTALAMHLFKTVGLATISGPMPAGTQIGNMPPDHSKHYVRLLTDSTYKGELPGLGRMVLPGVSKGVLLGGNLTLLVHCAAAGGLPSFDGSILLIEDVNEPGYRIDRALTALNLGGFFSGIRGVVAGEFPGIEDQELEQILLAAFGDRGIPVLAGFPIGHGSLNVAVPIGGKIALDAAAGTVTLLEPAVC